MQGEALEYYIHDGSDALRFQLSGSLIGRGAESVHNAWQTALSIVGDRAVIADIRRVVEVDDRGRELLGLWNRHGVRIIRQAAEGRSKTAHAMTKQIARPSRRGLNIVVWSLQILAAAVFLMAGGSKAAPAPLMVAEFDTLGLGQWFRYLTGLLEVVGAIGLLLPRGAFYGASMLAAAMAGAFAAHALALSLASAIPAFVMLVLTSTIAYFRRDR